MCSSRAMAVTIVMERLPQCHTYMVEWPVHCAVKCGRAVHCTVQYVKCSAVTTVTLVSWSGLYFRIGNCLGWSCFLGGGMLLFSCTGQVLMNGFVFPKYHGNLRGQQVKK